MKTKKSIIHTPLEWEEVVERWGRIDETISTRKEINFDPGTRAGTVEIPMVGKVSFKLIEYVDGSLGIKSPELGRVQLSKADTPGDIKVLVVFDPQMGFIKNTFLNKTFDATYDKVIDGINKKINPA